MSVLNPLRRIGDLFEDFAGGRLGVEGAAFRQKVVVHLERLRLDPRILSAYPHELSGGMRQRVTIGLSTVCKPEFMIADEPTTALDVVVQKNVLALIKDLKREMGSSIIFVTHDMAVHAHMADRIGIILCRSPSRRGTHPHTFPERPSIPTPRISFRACPASVIRGRGRRSRDGRPISPLRRQDAAFTPAARSPSISAALRRHRW